MKAYQCIHCLQVFRINDEDYFECPTCKTSKRDEIREIPQGERLKILEDFMLQCRSSYELMKMIKPLTPEDESAAWPEIQEKL